MTWVLRVYRALHCGASSQDRACSSCSTTPASGYPVRLQVLSHLSWSRMWWTGLWLILLSRGGFLCSSVPSSTFAGILAVLSATCLESCCLVWSHQTCQDSVLPTEKVPCICTWQTAPKPRFISCDFLLQSSALLVPLLFSFKSHPCILVSCMLFSLSEVPAPLYVLINL